MNLNWQCGNCQANNPPPREKCWQCQTPRAKKDSPVQTPLATPSPAPPPTRVAPPTPLTSRTFAHYLEELKQENERKRARADRLAATIIGLLFCIIGLFVMLGPWRTPSRNFTSGTLLWTLLLVGGGQALLFFALRPRWRLFAGQAALFLVAALFFTVTLGRNRVDTGMMAQAAAVCNGTGIAQAAPYPSGEGPRQILVMYRQSGQSILRDDYPAGWLPTQIETLQLVACVELSWQILEECEYDPAGVVSREQQQMVASLYAAQTGQLLDEIILDGGIPGRCKTMETFEGSQRTKAITGSPVALGDLFAELTTYVR